MSVFSDGFRAGYNEGYHQAVADVERRLQRTPNLPHPGQVDRALTTELERQLDTGQPVAVRIARAPGQWRTGGVVG